VILAMKARLVKLANKASKASKVKLAILVQQDQEWPLVE
jgi:hypothetical protein